MKSIRIFAVGVLVALAFGTVAYAQQTAFDDVDVNAWYKADVQRVCEDGFMNGVGNGLFSPNSSFTVAQGITVASRINASSRGTDLQNAAKEVQDVAWYIPYVDYALTNKIIYEGQFDSYDRELTRGEMAQLFAACLDKSHFSAINNVSEIPDVDSSEQYVQDLLMLYNAGILSGSDEYGYFYPNRTIKRSEAAAIINRTANKHERKSFTLKQAPKDLNGYYLVDDQSMISVTRGTSHLMTSWNYENRCDSGVNTKGTTTNMLSDTSSTGYVSINRDITVTSEGIFTFASTFSVAGINSANGARIYFENSNGENIFELCTQEDMFKVKTGNVYNTGVAAEAGTYNVKVTLDLDNKKGIAAINGQKACEFKLDNFTDIAKLYYSTSKQGALTLTPTFTQVYVNYLVNDTFFEGIVPYDYKGQAKIKSFNNSRDVYSLELEKTSKVQKSFEITSGKVRFESYVYLPDNKNGAYVSLDNDGVSTARVDIAGNTVKAGNISHSFKNHIWQCIVIEADTQSGKAVLYVNGKNKGEFGFDSQSFDGISLGFDKKSDGSVYFDDIKVSRVSEVRDYCPAPQKAESKDYIVYMSVCSLWREGTHYGWDYVSPYDECTPIQGYYDEGSPEAMDWEIKFMAEHGVDAMQYCWYSGVNSGMDEPQKNPRLVWALNDGYMYAKYSDMVDFSLLWEAANFKNASFTIEQFKKNIWDYWVEWYFRDDRYMKVNGKAVLQFYQPKTIINAAGGEQNAKKIVDFMRQDIKNYGYDGLILLATFDCSDKEFAKQLARIGFDGAGAYGWDKNAYDPLYLNSLNKRGVDNTADIDGFAYLPTISAGNNILGWENTRNPMATTSQHAEVLEYTKNLVAEQGKTKGNEWQDKMIYFSTWNEYGEGHWLAPSGLCGFGYVDEYRKAFTDAKLEHVDTIPTLKQRQRISMMYTNTRQPIRSLLKEDYSEQGETQLIKSYVFDDASKLGGWRSSNIINMSCKDNALYGKSVSTDPIFISPDNQDINASVITNIKIRLKVSTLGSCQLFFITDKDRTWDESKSFKMASTKANEYVEIDINTAKNALWKNTIEQIRFDPMIVSNGEFWVQSIEMYGITEQQLKSKPKVIVDTIELALYPQYITITDSEFYVAADPATGIMSANNIYYEWNRHQGRLFLKTQNDTEFVFNVGNSEAFVNGKKKSLAKPMYTFDAMPVLPMRFILDNAGISYKTSGNKLVITNRGVNFSEVMNKRVPYEYEFELPDDHEGWTVGSGNSYVSDGKLVLGATVVPSATSTGYDPKIHQDNLELPASKYKKIIVRMKHELLPNLKKYVDTSVGIYFATTHEGSLDEVKTCRVAFADGVDDGDGYKLYTFNIAENPKWTGTVKILRFDPSNNNGVYTIDYIRVIE